MSDGVELAVLAAEKRDAGRGVARLPEDARDRLGVLSGDTVVVSGERPTVAKVWPGTAEGVRIDADTRANAGVTVGETVIVEPVSVDEARAVTLAAPGDLDEAEREAVRAGLLDRPLRVGETVTVERVGLRARVVGTDPDGAVRVTERTDLTLQRGSARPEAGDDESETEDVDHPDGATYEDIGGLDDELELVRETIELPLAEPERFRRLGIDPPKGVLLHGPPGTGKTLIARAVAHEVEAHFEVVSGPEIVSKYKGESEEQLRATFERAEAEAPSIVFVDELDSIAARRDEDADMENRVVAQLLTLLDGLEGRGDVVVVGATNRVDAIDPALRRGGRFDREVEIGPPDEAGRREVLDVHTRGMALADDVDLDVVAARTHGFVGADIEQVATEAAMVALRRGGEEPTVTHEDFREALAAVEPSAMREHVAEAPETTFDDVGGLADAKRTLEEVVRWPLRYGPLFDATDTDPPSGVLLHGPPGTGKTLLARALAGESDVNFVAVNGPELLDRYVGESERAVRDLFDRARQAAPAIVFLDEVDALAGARGAGHEVTERVVSQLLTELDGLEDNPDVVVVAATNRPESLDQALLRPGRLETHVTVPEPDRAARREILAVHLEDKPLAPGVDLDELAVETEGYSGAELAALARSAAMRAIREVASETAPEDAADRAGAVELRAAHFEAALAEH